ncbi:MAG: TetR/AcrR family transcriptional regulator [Verrucomicrobiota bacterium]
MGRTSDAKLRLLTAVMDLILEQNYGSATVDAICERAKVKKGSFYYFFKSKGELAAAALEHNWECKREAMDALFSPTVPPLERLENFFIKTYQTQVECKKEKGNVLGCPMFTLGSEVSTQEPELRQKVEELINRYICYLTSAIRDAKSEGLIEIDDPHERARNIFAYFEGALTQARILNDPEILRGFSEDVFKLVGAFNSLKLEKSTS